LQYYGDRFGDWQVCWWSIVDGRSLMVDRWWLIVDGWWSIEGNANC
jgi:hypothetical protein